MITDFIVLMSVASSKIELKVMRIPDHVQEGFSMVFDFAGHATAIMILHACNGFEVLALALAR